MGLASMIVFALLSILNLKDSCSLITALVTITLSTLPDIDLKLEIKHRKYTHNIVAAILFGIIIGLVFNFASLSFMNGFIAGLGGSLIHLLGDILTKRKFSPLFPLYKKKIALGFFKSNDKRVNNIFFILGFLTFMFYTLFIYTNFGWRVINSFIK